ncbi:unnamed protein product, partial [Choristocarpus tenellus]
WCLGEWDAFKDFVDHVEETVVDGAYFRAVLALRSDDLEGCARYIDKARLLVDGSFASQIGESYKRAYTTMTMVQQLVELEEIVEYKQ